MNGQKAAMRAPVTPDGEPLGATGGLAPVVQPACASRDGMGWDGAHLGVGLSALSFRPGT